MENVINVINVLRKSIYFRYGLIILVIASEVLYYIVCKSIGSNIINAFKTFNFPITTEWFNVAFIFGLFTIPIIDWIIWRIFRAVPHFRKGELGIFFSPNACPGSQDHIDRLFVHLKQEIKSHEFGIRFNLYHLPPNITIDSHKEAVSILHKAKATVIIWGTIEQQKSEKGSTTGFSRLSVTFTSGQKAFQPARQAVMCLSLLGRHFQINERTQIADQTIMAKDIGIIVRNTLGVSLLYNEQYQQALRILAPLHQELQQIKNNKSPITQAFHRQVQYDYAYSLTNMALKEYRIFLLEKGIFDIPFSTLSNWIIMVNKAIDLDPQNAIHYLAKAIFLFLIGNTNEAIKVENNAKKFIPKRDKMIVYLSLGFLCNFNGKYRSFSDNYKSGLSKKYVEQYDEMISDCISFIQQVITKYPDKKQQHLALGMLEHYRGSVDNACQEYRALFEVPPSDPELQAFVSAAKQLYNMAKQDKPLEEVINFNVNDLL